MDAGGNCCNNCNNNYKNENNSNDVTHQKDCYSLLTKK